MKRIDVDDSPHLALFAVRDIKTGEELRYDYGETSKYLPWRKKSKITNVRSTTNTDEASDDKDSLPKHEVEREVVKTQMPLISHSNDDTEHDSSQDKNHYDADDLESHDLSSSVSSQLTNPADSSSINSSLKSHDSIVHHEDIGSTHVHSSYIQSHGKSTDPGNSSEVLSADNNAPSMDDLDLLSTKQKILKHTERDDFRQGSLLCESSLLESKQKMCDGSLPTEQVLSSKLQMTKKCYVSLKRFCISKLKGGRFKVGQPGHIGRKRNNSKEHKRAEYISGLETVLESAPALNKDLIIRDVMEDQLEVDTVDDTIKQQYKEALKDRLQQLPDLSQHVSCTETIVQDDIPLLPPPPPPPKLRVQSLPPNWEFAKDLEGNVYYYHAKTRQTQWSLPVWDDCNSQNDVDIRTSLDEDKTATRNENTKSVTGNLLSMGTESEVIPPYVTDDLESTMYAATRVPSMNEDDLLAKVCISELWKWDKVDMNVTVGKIENINVTLESLFFMRGFLPDEVIDAYLHQLTVGLTGTIFINSTIMTAIANRQTETHGCLQEVNFQEYDCVIGAVNEGENHWILLIILPQEKMICYYNPMGETFLSLHTLMENWYFFMKERSDFMLDGNGTWRFNVLDHSKQLDSISCGVYVLKMAEMFLSGGDVQFVMTAEDLNQYRLHIGAVILRQCGLLNVHQSIVSKRSVKSTCGITNLLSPGQNTELDSGTNESQYSGIVKLSDGISVQQSSKVSQSSIGNNKVISSETIQTEPCTEETEVSCSDDGTTLAGNRSDDGENEEEAVHVDDNNKGLKGTRNPKRPCPFCGIFQSRLSRHILTKHRDNDEVKAAKQLPVKDRNQVLCNLKRRGYHQYNLMLMKEDDFDVNQIVKERQARKQREGDAMENRAMCSSCQGYFVKEHLKIHRIKCTAAEGTTITPTAIPLSAVRDDGYTEDYKADILSGFLDDTSGKFCKTDKYLKDFGFHSYRRFAARKDKNPQNRKNIMKHMRMLANLFFCFKSEAAKIGIDINATLDMFKMEHFTTFMDAIHVMAAKDDGGMKSGLKKNLGHLLKNVIRHIKGQHLLQGKRDELVKIEEFKTLFDYYRKEIFDGAEYNCIKNRQENLRRPQYLPLDDDVRRLRNYTLSGIAQMDDPYQILDVNEYPRLRDLVVARITLFNAKRGGEPSRLTLKEWNDEKDGVWLDETHKKKAKTSEELELFEIYKLSYQSGKSVCHMLPTLIPKDSWKAIRKLADPQIRQMAGVKPTNIYVFPNIQGSNFHVNGWNSVNKVCKQAGLTKEINATQMRHYMSTVFANLDVPETDRQAFYRHMGHSEEINKHVYQCPLAVQEITKVGKFFYLMDKDGIKAYPDSQSLPAKMQNADQEDVAGTSYDNSGGTDENTDITESDEDSGSSSSFGKAKRGKKRKNRVIKYSSSEDDSSPQSDDSSDEGNIQQKRGLKRKSKDEEIEEEIAELFRTRKKGRRYVQWSEKDSNTVKSYFKQYIQDVSKEGAKGRMPGFKDIKIFMELCPNVMAQESDFLTRRDIIKSKVFNERKKFRGIYEERKKKFSC
ncbi:uncharacterized protein LOC127702809 [Mytilus californianus]|uniref:uncharacterized protein LOC127702809 n=1 Tax=Mytilus californianus TaxID=6549 RepID=UPI002247C31E|nr:uncharacterized protein LOC127702809 [Mytilus californianus]